MAVDHGSPARTRRSTRRPAGSQTVSRKRGGPLTVPPRPRAVRLDRATAKERGIGSRARAGLRPSCGSRSAAVRGARRTSGSTARRPRSEIGRRGIRMSTWTMARLRRIGAARPCARERLRSGSHESMRCGTTESLASARGDVPDTPVRTDSPRFDIKPWRRGRAGPECRRIDRNAPAPGSPRRARRRGRRSRRRSAAPARRRP